jgi:predicted nucleic acid-binding protein
MIIDTNVYGKMQNASPDVVQLLSTKSDLKIPLPVISELKAVFMYGALTVQNIRSLTQFLNNPKVSILYPSFDTTRIYGELQMVCWKRGKALSNNDIWIASLAREDGDLFVTYDTDFVVFQDIFGEKLKILT